MAKYKVCDKVRVRSDLKIDKRYYMEDEIASDVFVGGMQKWLGGIVTIRKIDRKYYIKEDGFAWTDEMFEGLAEVEFHVFDTVRHKDYGLGTVLKGRTERTAMVLVDFDEWNEDFPTGSNTFYCSPKNLTLVQAYSPN